MTISKTRIAIALAVVLIFTGLSAAPALLAHYVFERPGAEVAEWLAGGATLGALIAAAVAAVLAAAAVEREARRDRRWQEQQESAQASLVAAWYGTRPWDYAGGFPVTQRGILIRNASDVPVTQAEVEIYATWRRPTTNCSRSVSDPRTSASSRPALSLSSR